MCLTKIYRQIIQGCSKDIFFLQKIHSKLNNYGIKALAKFNHNNRLYFEYRHQILLDKSLYK